MSPSFTIEEISKLLDAALFHDVATCVPSDADKTNPLFFAYRGYAHWKLEHFIPAIADFSVAIVMRSNAVNTLFLRGRCHEELENFSEAATDYIEVLRNAPNTADAHAHLGFCLEQLGDVEGALQSYSAALKIDPDETLALAGIEVLTKSLIH